MYSKLAGSGELGGAGGGKGGASPVGVLSSAIKPDVAGIISIAVADPHHLVAVAALVGVAAL